MKKSEKDSYAQSHLNRTTTSKNDAPTICYYLISATTQWTTKVCEMWMRRICQCEMNGDDDDDDEWQSLTFGQALFN